MCERELRVLWQFRRKKGERAKIPEKQRESFMAIWQFLFLFLFF